MDFPARTTLLLLLAIALALAPATVVAAQKRVALVIGNSQYASFPQLQNPYNDAHAVADKLRGLGFRLIGNTGRESEGPLLDLDESAFQRAIRAFAKAAQGSEIAFVYYAGHGLQIGSENYLLPVDVPAGNMRLVQRNALSLEALLRRLDQSAELTVAVFDACREIPDLAHGFTASAQRGLARLRSKGRSRIVAFSSAAGQWVEDGANQEHSPYTQELLVHLDRAGIEIGDLFRQVAFSFAQNQGSQEPEVLIQGVPPGKYYLGSAPEEVAGPRLAGTNGNDQAFWNTTVLCGTARCYDAYLQAYPNGRFAGEAQRELSRLTRSIVRTTPREPQAPPPAAAPPPPPPLATQSAAAERPGFLQVISNVRATVRVNDTDLGTVEPNKPLNVSSGLPAGEILVRAEVQGQIPKQQRTVIKSDAWSTVVFQFARAEGAAAAPPPPPPPPPRSADNLGASLEVCRLLLEANKLAVGEQNAISCYGDILERHPENAQARQGLKDVEDRYRDLTVTALQRGQTDKAASYIDRLASLNPSHPSLGVLRRDLQTASEAIRQREAQRRARLAAEQEAERRRQEELQRKLEEEERMRQEEEARQSITRCLDRASVEKRLCEEREQRKVAECKSDKREEAYLKFQADILTEYPEQVARYERCVADYERQQDELRKAMKTAVFDHQVIPESLDPKSKRTLQDACGTRPDKPQLESYLDLSGCKADNACGKEYQLRVDACSRGR